MEEFYTNLFCKRKNRFPLLVSLVKINHPQTRVILLPRAYVAGTGDILGLSHPGGEMNPGGQSSRRWRVLDAAGHRTAQNANGAHFEKSHPTSSISTKRSQMGHCVTSILKQFYFF